MQPDQLAQLQQFSARLNTGASSPSSSRRVNGSQSQGQPAPPPTMGLNRGLSEKFGDKLTESKRVCVNLLVCLLDCLLLTRSLAYLLTY